MGILGKFLYNMKYCQNPTKLDSTQLYSKQLKSNFLGLDIIATWNPPPHYTHTNFSVTSRPARELKFGTDTH